MYFFYYLKTAIFIPNILYILLGQKPLAVSVAERIKNPVLANKDLADIVHRKAIARYHEINKRRRVALYKEYVIAVMQTEVSCKIERAAELFLIIPRQPVVRHNV